MKKTLFLLLLTTFAAVSQTAVPPPAEKISASTVYRTPEVDSKPEIEDGMYTLPLFISKNFKLPEVHNKKLKLFVGFIIEPDGTMSDVKFIYLDVKTLDDSKAVAQTEEQKNYETAQLETMKAEAIRVVSAFRNRWKPAIKEGKQVRCQYNYPINFNLE